MDSMYDTYYNKPLCYGHDCVPDEQDKTSPTYVLDYEDTAKIPFYIDEEFWDCAIIVSLYDFRHELIKDSTQYVDEEGYVYLTIDKEFSSLILKRGVYYCGIQAAEVFLANSGEYEYGNNITTIMNQNDCMINVR